MIKTLFKYHIRVLDIYHKYDKKAFPAKEIYALEIPGLSVSTLETKGYLEVVSRTIAEVDRPEIKEWYEAPWVFRRLTREGIKLAEYLEDHPELIAKKLLSI